MPNQNTYELLQKLADALAVVTKRTGLSLDEVTHAIHTGWEHAQVDIPDESIRPFSLSERNLFGRILSVWRTNPTFVDAQGEPLSLPVTDDSGPSFTSLFLEALRLSSMDKHKIDAPTTLEIFEHNSIVAVQQDGRILPAMVGFHFNRDPATGAQSNLAYLADFAGNCSINSTSGDDGLFSRVARCQQFPLRKIPVITAMLEEQGLKFLQQVDAFIERESALISEDEERTDVGVGLYLLSESRVTVDEDDPS